MTALMPTVATPDTTICGRCGGVHVAGGTGAITCQVCLGSDLAEDTAEWFAAGDAPADNGLRAAGGFTLLEEIGHGGMGQVFRARQESPEREVAVKLLMPHLSGSEDTRRRFLTEAEAMAGLEHPGLLPLYACGETDGRPWLVTRLAGGGNLAQRRARYAGQWRKIAELTAHLADAMQHAHARGIIHRDLKPSNVLFDSEDGACIADFGLAKWRDENAAGQTLSNAMMGTPAYMAPELARLGARAATTAADVYGLGAILYELLTGRPPHTGGNPVEILLDLATSDPPRPRNFRPDMPRDLEVICLRSLAREPAGRYETAAALAADLRRFVAGETVSARPYSLPERAARWACRRPLAAGLTGALAAVMAVSAVVIVRKNTDLRRTNQNLTIASTGWQAAADDAEERVDYAVETLPDKLAPLGKLAVLDGLFADVSAHYQRARTAPVKDRNAAEVREAAFLIKWGRILRPQGRIPEAEAKLKEAELIGARVTARADAPARAWAALAQARQSSGLLALRKGNPAEAQQRFADAISTADDGLKRFPAQPELLLARAEAITERCAALISGAGGEPASLDELEAAWRAAEAGTETAQPSVRQELLRNVAKVHFYRGTAAAERHDWPASEKHFQALLAEQERLAELPAASGEDQRNIALACSGIARAIQEDEKSKLPAPDRLAVMMALLNRQHRIMDRILKDDPTNLRWKADAAGMRYNEASPASIAEDHDRAIVLLQEAAEMIHGVPNEVSSTLEGGRPMILNSLAWQRMKRAGKLSQAAKNPPGDALEAEIAAARQAACDAANAAFASCLEAFPCPLENAPKKGIIQCWGIWKLHGAPGYARSRMELALEQAASPGLAGFLKSQLAKMDAEAVGVGNSKTRDSESE